MSKPGHFLPNFIDWMERDARTPLELRAAHRETVAHMKRASRNGIRFALNDTLPGVLPDKTPLIGANLRPPYPITVIEYSGGRYQNVIVAEDLGTHVKLRSYASLGDAGVAVCPFEVRFEYVDHWVQTELRCWSPTVLNKRARDRNETREELIQSAAEILDGATSIYARLCEVLANNHVETTDVPPDAKENRIRRVKGQAPLYTYKTLVVGERKETATSRGRGGTHASPRSHLRRGYYRTSKKGVRHWVSSAYVNGAPGFVHKDYEIK
jgi:hypothetical protein